MIKDLNVRPKSIKLLGRNKGEKPPYIGFGDDFLGVITKAQAAKEKADPSVFMKIKNLCIKRHNQRVKNITQRMIENICKPYF